MTGVNKAGYSQLFIGPRSFLTLLQLFALIVAKPNSYFSIPAGGTMLPRATRLLKSIAILIIDWGWGLRCLEVEADSKEFKFLADRKAFPTLTTCRLPGTKREVIYWPTLRTAGSQSFLGDKSLSNHLPQQSGSRVRHKIGGPPRPNPWGKPMEKATCSRAAGTRKRSSLFFFRYIPQPAGLPLEKWWRSEKIANSYPPPHTHPELQVLAIWRLHMFQIHAQIFADMVCNMSLPLGCHFGEGTQAACCSIMLLHYAAPLWLLAAGKMPVLVHV